MRGRLLITVFAAALYPCQASWGATEGTPSAQDIFDRMVRNYSEARSYQGSGIVVESWSVAGWFCYGLQYKPFEIRFVRPHLFRFDWSRDHPFPPLRGFPQASIVWSDGVNAFSYFHGVQEKESDLGLALSGANGVSGGSARTVPGLLMKDVAGFRLTSLAHLSLIRDEVFEGEPCYVLGGRHPQGAEYELWIGKQDYLLRKKTVRHGTAITEEIHREIRVDAEITGDVFRVEPGRGLALPGFTVLGLVLFGFGALGLVRRRPLVIQWRLGFYALLLPFLVPSLWANAQWLLEGSTTCIDVGSSGWSAAAALALILGWRKRDYLIVGIRGDECLHLMRDALQRMKVAFSESGGRISLSERLADVYVTASRRGYTVALRIWPRERYTELRDIVGQIARDLRESNVKSGVRPWLLYTLVGIAVVAFSLGFR